MRPEMPESLRIKWGIFEQKAKDREIGSVEQHDKDEWGIIRCTIEGIKGREDE